LALVAHVDVGHHRQVDDRAANHRHKHRAQVDLLARKDGRTVEPGVLIQPAIMIARLSEREKAGCVPHRCA
jgi:hypothetical protein